MRVSYLKFILLALTVMFVCCGCESTEPLYMHVNMDDIEVTYEEYKRDIYTKTIDDSRNKNWLKIKPIKVNGAEKDSILKLVNSFINERYNWHEKIKINEFGNSDSIYSQRYINEMSTHELNKYNPFIVNEYKLTSIINYASIMPKDYVQKKIENEKIHYRVYVEMNLNIRASSSKIEFKNEMFHNGSNIISFWIFILEESEGLRIDGWYEMIQKENGNLVIPYWSKYDVENSAI